MNAPTLIVGLGGAGSKIVTRVYNKAAEEQLKTIGFAVFDTDINEMRDIQKNTPMIKTIQTSTKLSVGEYLNIDQHSRDTWFPVNAILNSKTLTEGAGQVRAISRLAFETSIRAGKLEPLHEAIQDLYKLDEDAPEQALRIIIVSSLAGGTGSGLLLPVALYIRNYLATRFRQNASITRGFFILPEVFDEVIPGQAERNNLRSNAYAALRELDAFLMKGDDTLQERYKSTVKMDFPRTGSSGYEEYIIRPYDFCFLFDAQNAEGKKLNSYNQYLDHAANCIYAQSIGPMNKRSNSSEDNTIRALCAERGRNRYAGAGTSMLIYPVEDVKEYIAMNWARECVSEQWLKFDNLFRELNRINAEKRSRGITVTDLNPARNYVDQVEALAKQKDPFARSIVNACSIYDGDGITKVSESWEEYASNLISKIEIDEASGQQKLDGQKMIVMQNMGELEGGKDSWDAFIDTYRELEKYKAMILRHCEDTAHTIAFTVFKASSDSVTSDRQSFRLETYLRDGENNFIHPNAVRYFLYKAYELLKDHYTLTVDENRKILAYFDNFSSQFDDPTTEGTETVENLSDRKISIINKIGKSFTSDQQALKDAYNSYLTKANEYRVKSVLEKVLEEGMEYIQSLCKALEVFFRSFEGKVSTLEKRIDQIAGKYENTKGQTAIHVNASRVCLELKAKALPYMGSVISIDSELADEIYSKVHKYASLSVKPKDDAFFSDLFEVGIIGYFKSKLMESYSSRVDLDIIDALEEECKHERGEENEALIHQYVRDTIRATWKLSCPFIEKPLGEERQPIFASTYNPGINPKDTSTRTDIIEKEFKSSVPDEDIPKNMVLFYQSFYGLRANDLSKFAPPEKSETSNRDGGEYFKAYFNLIEAIHPEPHKSKAVTPHIDRWWHAVTHMPDIDDDNQLHQEYEIFAALFWALAGKLIDLFNKDTENQMYRLDSDMLKLEEGYDTLVVSNGTPCDHLYEILDALSVYPELIKRILKYIEQRTTRDIFEGNLFGGEENMLTDFLESFRLDEFPLNSAKEKNLIRSVFDLPMLLRRSVKTDLYQEEFVLRLLKATISEIQKYLSQLFPVKELPMVMGDLILSQFDRFLEGIALEVDAYKDVYQDFLFTKICNNIQLALDELGLRKEALSVKKKVEALRK